jgi:putative DNA primase/helicase
LNDDGIPITPPDPLRMAWYELSDLGNAQRLRDLAMGKLLWVEDHWVAYDGKRWSGEDGRRLAQRLAHDVARHIPAEAEALAEHLDAMDAALREKAKDRYEEKIAALIKHGIQSGNTAKTQGMLAQAQSELFALRDDFDSDPFAINVQNGTLRLRRDADDKWRTVLTPHDPADMITRIAAVEYDPKAQCPHWMRHMETVLPIPAVRDFFQQCVGYGWTGEIREQCIFLLQGKGGDGKSTTMNVLREIAGGFGATADVQTFMAGAQRSGGEASPDLARLAGDTRIVSTGEPRPGGMLDEGRIKSVTGGSPITARELHGAPFEYTPRFKVFFECNRKPRVSGDDDGIWRRMVVILFPHQFKGTAADKQAQRRLLDEGPGILNWVLAGAIAWLESDMLTAPAEVQEAIDDYRKAANPFGEWFMERVDTRDPAARTAAKDLYASYKTWCEENAVGDREIMTSTAFGRALSDKQIPKMKGANGTIQRKGARLRDDSELFGGGGAGSSGGPDAPPDAPYAGPYDDDDAPPGWG